jgi:glycosyltransferase involved in cell wall biosynthesis
VLLAAGERLAERFPNIRVSVAGEGEERPALEALARELGVATHVDFVGPLPHIAAVEFLAESDIVIVPSLIEPFGLVALEAAQAGRPVVASAVDGLPEVVVHGETGLLVPPSDPRALSDAIAALLLDRPRADALGAAGRRRAETAFRWDDYVDAYERLFRSLSAQSK